MFKAIPKRNRRNILILIIIIIITIMLLSAYNTLQARHHKHIKLEKKIEQRPIRSRDNQVPCLMPHLPVDSPVMLAFLKDEPPIECGNEEDDWVQCRKSTCSIRKSILKKRPSTLCAFTDILRLDDYQIMYGQIVLTTTTYTLKNSDFVRVLCWAEDLSEWSGILFGIRENASDMNTNATNKSGLKLNVLIYGFDSLSRNAFIRKLPSSYNYLVNEMHGDVLKEYNIIGDGTQQALIPMLTGFTELDLPETRKRMKHANYVNEYPMIWKDYKEQGYVTAYNEDQHYMGTFTYHLTGFGEQPTDHYMRSYYLALQRELSNYSRLCAGHVPRHKVMMDYTTQFMQAYRQPRFIFNFYGELSHASINLIGCADQDLTSWLKELKESGVLNSTILILMSGHGTKFTAVRQTLQGKQEERLPFFSFVFPEWFKVQFKKQYDNFQMNLNRLTTPFDIHATLKDILRIQLSNETIKKPHFPSHSISLFDEIPANRSCDDAYIKSHWCACLIWHPLNDLTSTIVQRVAIAVVDHINEYTADARHLCAELALDEVKWAAKLSPHDDVFRFMNTYEIDGYYADSTELKTLVTSITYKVKITVNPGGGIYEANVTHDWHSGKFVMKMSDVLCLNSKSGCIMDINPELRKICYCI